MFFFVTVTDRTEQLDYHRVTECPVCGRTGGIDVFMTFRCFSLFFLPLFKFGRRYYAKMSCCGAAAELPGETGEAILRGEDAEIPENLWMSARRAYRVCPNCGYRTDGDYDYCPYCGHPLM